MAQTRKPARKTTASRTGARRKPTPATAATRPSATKPARDASPVFQFEGMTALAAGGSALQFHEVKATVKATFKPGTARAIGATQKVTVLANDIIEIEFDGGVRLWMSGEDYKEQFLKGTSRDVRAAGPIAPPATLQVLPSGMQSRGPIGWVVKALRVFGIDLGEKTAQKIAHSVDTKATAKRPGLGLYACGIRYDTFFLGAPQPGWGKDSQPILLFLHGTASSTWGSFGELWSPARAAERTALAKLYDDRVAAFEHASLSQSPIENARDLVKALPKGARLHVVSHSRGGLVGELLCRANRVGGTAFEATELEAYGAALDARAKALKEPSAKDRHLAALKELNELLRQKQIVVERFVRVACPALGTTLASGRLDRWLSVIGSVCSAALPDTPLSDWLSDIGDFIGSVISEKTDPATLPGLEAMMPDSGLIRLVNWPAAEVSGDLAVIAGDIAPDAWWAKLLVWVTDRFYDGEHDLVVNTASMSGGAKRTEQALLSFHQGAAVNHFNYFQNADSAARLVLALEGKASVDNGFKPLVAPTAPIARALVLKPKPGPRPVVFLLPGIMGSELMVKKSTVWVDLPKLMFGGLAKLGVGAADVQPRQPVVRYYGDLSRYLESSHKVIDFAFDWRLPPEAEAKRLAQAVSDELAAAQNAGQPIRLLAHSMGGLIARTMIANHPNVWVDMCKRPGARLVMLGTPNGGSHAINEMIVGQSSTMKGLAILDLKHDLRELLEIVTQFPGVLAMLPKDLREDYFDPAVWAKYAAHAGGGWVVPPAKGLTDARRFRDTMDRALVDPEHMVYVAGTSDATPAAMRFDEATGRIEILATTQGDGRVTWDSGIPPGVPTWYMNAEHGDLSAYAPAFPAIQELLETGKTTRLPTAPKVSRGVPALFPMPRDTDAVYPSEEVLTATMLGAKPRKRQAAKPVETPVSVSVLHADLAYAKYPVAVGHYTGDTIISAEKALDNALGNALSRRQQLGLYPGPIGTSAIFANPNLARDPTASPRGAIVIGLGTAGQLTAATVARVFRHGLLEHVLAVGQNRLAGAAGSTAAQTKFEVSALLIGTGAGGISVADCVYALLKGVASANEALSGAGQIERFATLEIVELFEDRAIQGIKAMQELRRNPDIDQAFVFNDKVQSASGGLRRVSFDEPAGWWHRIQVLGGGKDGEPGDGTLRFSSVTRRARAEVQLQRTQLKLVDEFVEQAIRQTSDNELVARTLFELLLPNELKDQAPDQDNTVLLLDEESARYPWELLRDPLNPGRKPNVVEHGVLRQLESFEYRETVRIVTENAALVVGDPVSSFPPLPGAQHEAEAVARVLRAKGTVVEELINPTASAVLQSLYQQPYRILHLAGHGVYRYLLPGALDCDACGQQLPEGQLQQRIDEGDRITGMVIGDNAFLTPLEVRQMRRVPELVFINCCHLGHIEGEAPDEARHNLRRDFHKIAANVSTEFIRMGVRAVIAAGWAVDDAAASVFAKRFYEEMLAGAPFGAAVRAAREEAYDAAPHLNTWGAYQCYGDPDYRLERDGGGFGGSASMNRHASASEAVTALDNLASRLSLSANDPKVDRDRLEELIESLKTQGYLSDPSVLAAAGRAHGQAEQFDAAIDYLRSALSVDNCTADSNDIETLANLEARYAVPVWESGDATRAMLLIDAAIERIEDLMRVASPDELAEGAPLHERAGANSDRLALLGSAYKRKARISAGTERDKLLARSLDCYRRAYHKAPAPYPLLNALTLELASGWQRSAGLPAARLKAIESEALRLEVELETAASTDRRFWTAATLSEAALVAALCHPGIDAAALDRARNRYRDAAKRGSPRQLRSALDQIDILIHLADKKPSIAQALQALHDAIAPAAQAAKDVSKPRAAPARKKLARKRKAK
ncbi:MAG: CHAT domain-containing protein [Burkholderiales bacterium]|nr:CHAT domain-containing protein [Burkholderiales bacterium]